MKDRMQSRVLVWASLLCLASMPVDARPAIDGGATTGASRPLVASIPAYLQMQPGQVEAVRSLFDGYAARRAPQMDRIAQWQDQLRQQQASSAFDQGDRLRRAINDAQQQVTADLLATRTKALKTLTPVQRAQLEALPTDARFQVRRDEYYELLLMPVASLWQVPLASGAAAGAPTPGTRQQPQTHESGRVGYGVYGGYGYGQPQYGVYGSYGQGSVGVQVGVGRGGPSVGIGFGGIFGGWHRH